MLKVGFLRRQPGGGRGRVVYSVGRVCTSSSSSLGWSGGLLRDPQCTSPSSHASPSSVRVSLTASSGSVKRRKRLLASDLEVIRAGCSGADKKCYLLDEFFDLFCPRSSRQSPVRAQAGRPSSMSLRVLADLTPASLLPPFPRR